MEITLELGDLLKRIFVRDPKKRITIQQIRDHPWVNIDYPDKILLVPALPPLDDAEDIGKAIGSVHNENEFTVYILKAHATSKKNSPSSSDSNVKLSRHHTSNGSSLKMDRSINFLEQSSSSNEIVMRGGRRASSHDNVKDSRHFQQKPTEPIPASHNALPRKSSKTEQNDLTLLLPSSFSNELSRKQSVSSQFSQEHRKHSTTLSESSSNYIAESARDWGRRGSASVSISPSRTSSLAIRTSTKMLEDDDILDVSEAADLAVKNISLTSRRMSVGPEKRAPAPVMIKEESFSGENLDRASDEEGSVAGSNHAHEEYSLKEYSYARRPSYRRASITTEPTSPTSPASPITVPRDMNTIILNPSPLPTTLLRRASFNVARRDSSSSRNNFPPAPKEIDIQSVTTTVPRVGSGNLTDDNEKEPPTRRRATTVTGTPGTKSSQSSSKFVVEERRDIWEDDSVKMTSSISTTSKLSNESSSLSTGDKTDKNANTIVTMEMINNWHQIHKPAKTVRTMRYSFNKSTTSSLYEPARIFQDVHKVLLDIADAGQDIFSLGFKRPTDLYLFECSIIYPNREELLKFDIEVCKVWLLKMHGIRIKRLQGDSFDYKQIHNDIVERLGYNG